MAVPARAAPARAVYRGWSPRTFSYVCLASSMSSHPAVNRKGDAGDIGRRVAGQEDDRGVEFVLPTESPEGGCLVDELVQHVSRYCGRHFALKVARRDR